MNGETGLVRETEAARVLGLSVRTLKKWRWSGRGPKFLRLNGAVRYDRADLEAFISSARRTSTSDTGAPPAPTVRATTEPDIDEVVAKALRAAGITPASWERAATASAGQ
jgi:predicted DNA-binding transcriptional regulator AlpA